MDPSPSQPIHPISCSHPHTKNLEFRALDPTRLLPLWDVASHSQSSNHHRDGECDDRGHYDKTQHRNKNTNWLFSPSSRVVVFPNLIFSSWSRSLYQSLLSDCKSPVRKRFDSAYPLRGFSECGSAAQPMFILGCSIPGGRLLGDSPRST